MATDERSTVAALDSCRKVFRDQVQSHGGRVVDMAGDSVLALFETASGAVMAALEIQEQIETDLKNPRHLEAVPGLGYRFNG